MYLEQISRDDDLRRARIDLIRARRLSEFNLAQIKLHEAKREHRRIYGFQSRLTAALKKGIGKSSVERELGYSMLDLRTHIQRQFVQGMTWDNHGYECGNWHIDHIVPKRHFNSIRCCYALSNLRPLWADENIKKGQVRTHLI